MVAAGSGWEDDPGKVRPAVAMSLCAMMIVVHVVVIACERLYCNTGI